MGLPGKLEYESLCSGSSSVYWRWTLVSTARAFLGTLCPRLSGLTEDSVVLTGGSNVGDRETRKNTIHICFDLASAGHLSRGTLWPHVAVCVLAFSRHALGSRISPIYSPSVFYKMFCSAGEACAKENCFLPCEIRTITTRSWALVAVALETVPNGSAAIGTVPTDRATSSVAIMARIKIRSARRQKQTCHWYNLVYVGRRMSVCWLQCASLDDVCFSFADSCVQRLHN